MKMLVDKDWCRDGMAADPEVDADAGRCHPEARGRMTPRQIVDEQAQDDGLWFRATTAPEAYLQSELRRLHASIERYDLHELADEMLSANLGSAQSMRMNIPAWAQRMRDIAGGRS